MNLKFNFSLKQELEDIAWIYSEHDFFMKNKYKVYYPDISEALTQKLIGDLSSKKNKILLKNEFQKIFVKDKDIYEKTISVVSQNWKKIENRFLFNLEKLNGAKTTNVTCFVSRYGPGGSYYPPNRVSIRVVYENEIDIDRASEKIAHEIVHLAVNDLSEKYELGFENTERLVDLILTKTPIYELLPDTKIQGFGNPKFDELFKQFPTNLIALLEHYRRIN